MKKLQPIIFVLSVIVLLAACQASSGTQKVLANSESRQEIMDTIAGNGDMSKQMMQAMMITSEGKTAMHNSRDQTMPDHALMMEKMKKDPVMMESMMTTMMEACKKDSVMMSGMCKKMMNNPEMMIMMEKMKGHKMKMGSTMGKDTARSMDHKNH